MVSADPAQISQAFSGFMMGDIGNLIVDIVVWTMIIGVFAAIFFVVYLFITYKYRITVLAVSGSGSTKQPHTVGKIKSDFARVNKDGSWQFLFNRKAKIEPIESKYIYAGKRVYMYELDGVLNPGKIHCSMDGISIDPVPYAMRKKTELELQQLEIDFAKMDAWEANKIFIYTLIGAGMVIVLAGFVLWLAFKKTDQMVPALQTFSQSLTNFNTIPGKG